MEGLYTAKEAWQKLGVTEDKFQYMVRTGQVNKVILPGRKRGMYSRAEIDALAAELNGPEQRIAEDEDQENTFFRRASVADVSEMYSIGVRIMSQSGIDFQVLPRTRTLEEWLNNPFSEVGHVLLNRRDIIGYIIMLPLKHEQIMQIMTKELSFEELEFRNLASLESGEPIDLFIVAIITDPSKKNTGAYLIRKMLKFFHTLGKQGIEIEGIYATAYSHESRALCLSIGMHEMTLPRELRSWIPFEMKVKETTNRYTRNYLQALKSYKEKQLRDKRVFRKVKHSELEAEAHADEHRKGSAASEYDRYEEALAAFEQAIQHDPNNADAFFGKGVALKLLGRSQEAEHAYKQAERLRRRSEPYETK